MPRGHQSRVVAVTGFREEAQGGSDRQHLGSPSNVWLSRVSAKFSVEYRCRDAKLAFTVQALITYAMTRPRKFLERRVSMEYQDGVATYALEF